MQRTTWIHHLIERADIGTTARGLKPRASTESVIGRLPRRLQKLWAAYTLQAEGVGSLLTALDAEYDYSQPHTSIEPLDSPTLRHELSKLRALYWVFWIAVFDEFKNLQDTYLEPGRLGIRRHWLLVRSS